MNFHVKKGTVPVLLAAGVLFLLLLTGCGKQSRLENAYSFEEREYGFSGGMSGQAPLFAENLCVITGETQDDDVSVSAGAGALFDVTDANVLYSKNATERMYPASITKVMTALIAIEEGNLSDIVTVTGDAVITEPGASLCGIKPGDQITMEQLLYGLMMPSGNDAANAIAVHMAGSMDAFVERMNESQRLIQ